MALVSSFLAPFLICSTMYLDVVPPVPSKAVDHCCTVLYKHREHFDLISMWSRFIIHLFYGHNDQYLACTHGDFHEIWLHKNKDITKWQRVHFFVKHGVYYTLYSLNDEDKLELVNKEFMLIIYCCCSLHSMAPTLWNCLQVINYNVNDRRVRSSLNSTGISYCFSST